MKCGRLRRLFGLRKEAPLLDMQTLALRAQRAAAEEHSEAAGAVIAAAARAQEAIASAKEGRHGVPRAS